MVDSEKATYKIVFKKQTRNKYLNSWTEKKMYGQFVQEITEDADKKKPVYRRETDLLNSYQVKSNQANL